MTIGFSKMVASSVMVPDFVTTTSQAFSRSWTALVTWTPGRAAMRVAETLQPGHSCNGTSTDA